MNKKIIIGIVVVLLVGGGVFVLSQNKKGTSAGNVVTSVKDALSKSASLECDYSDKEGRVSKTYMKNGAVRSDYTGKSDQDSGSVIVTDKKMYMWTADKKGFMYDIPQVTPAQGETAQTKEKNQKDDFLAELDQYKDSCKAAIVSDSLFTPPSDVEFTDYSNMMMPQRGQPQGTGPEGNSGMSQEQIKQYMDKVPTGQPDQNNPY